MEHKGSRLRDIATRLVSASPTVHQQTLDRLSLEEASVVSMYVNMFRVEQRLITLGRRLEVGLHE